MKFSVIWISSILLVSLLWIKTGHGLPMPIETERENPVSGGVKKNNPELEIHEVKNIPVEAEAVDVAPPSTFLTNSPSVPAAQPTTIREKRQAWKKTSAFKRNRFS